MPADKKSHVGQQLEALRQRFRSKLSAELAELQSRVQRIRAGEFISDDIVSAYQQLHRLSGSAGTFGFPALGERARALEIRLKPLAEAISGQPRDDGLRIRPHEVIDGDFVNGVLGLSDLVAAADQARADETSEAPSQARIQGEEPELVLVDRQLPSRAELAHGLTLHGFRVREAASMAEVAGLRSGSVAAVLVRDTDLPDASGGPLHRAVNAPVVCFGAEDAFLSRYRLAELGVDGFLAEPLDLPLLADYLERLIAEGEEAGRGKVMIVDDDPELLEHYSLVLEQGGFEIYPVNDPSTILSVLSEFRPDIVLMDMQMGRYNGSTLARMLRFDPEWLGLPIVYLSSEEDRNTQLEALSKGGDDFVTKPVSDDFLLRAVSVRCYRARQLDKLASRDGLTGLLKHSLVKAEVQKEHARSRRLGISSVVAMLDLDHFKQVNDRFGHRAGDMVIKGLANLLRHRLRKSDILGRYGGEEFLVVLPDCKPDDARRALQSICDQLAQIVFKGGTAEFSVTLSAGAAVLGEYDRYEAAIESADQALYRRKQSGRNGVTLAGDA